MARVVKFFLYVIVFSACAFCDVVKDKESSMKKGQLKNTNLPPCKLCTVLVDSFKKGLVNTAKSNFQGGNTAWEEKNLGDYASSEIRFVEIEDNLCNDVERGNSQCHTLAEENENTLRKWWFEEKQKPDLYEWMCIKELKYCCPPNHYGPTCLPCPGYLNSVCSGNGRCRGSGTRKGNGSCDCEKGYQGDVCESCTLGYYESYRDETKLLCTKCHMACRDSCTQAGTRGCKACNSGWYYIDGRGCLDINECIADVNPCTIYEFCINNEGSYSCLACDRACDGCQGDGPDMCDRCAIGYTLKDGLCVADEAKHIRQWDIRRYLTYFGLSVATCIIFQKNPVVASLIGMGVAIYVTLSEYMLSSFDEIPIFQF